MWHQRLFLTTRGKVLLQLKRHGPCTVAYLSQQLELTRNAIRQHLSALERDQLVTQQSRRTGPSKPAQVYSLTCQAESCFPKQYGSLLRGLVQELVLREGSDAAGEALAGLGRSAGEVHQHRLRNLAWRDRLAEVQRILEEEGAIAELEETEGGLVVRDYNCPYAAVAPHRPEVCRARSSFLGCLLEPARVEIGCDHQETRCQFLVRLPGENG